MQLFHKKILVLALAILLLAGSSCKKGWLDINYDPQQLTDKETEPYLLLPTVLRDFTPSGNYQFLSFWMGYLCPPSPYPNGYSITTYSIYQPDQTFQPLDFTQAIAQVIPLHEKAKASGEDFYLGIAKTVDAMLWTSEVDVRNNIPYAEFGKTHILQPKYDEGKFIYEEEMKQLDSAISLIKNADINKNRRIAQSDIMFHGDKTKWIKFINTLKLRMLVHQANRPDRQTYINAQVAKILAEGSGFLGSGENASINPGYYDYTEKRNRLYDKYAKNHSSQSWESLPGNSGLMYSWEMGSANAVSLNFLKQNNDPRLQHIFMPASMPLPPGAPEPFSQPLPTDYRGNKFGLPVNPGAFPFQNSNYVSQLRCPPAHLPVTPAASGIIKGYDMDGYILSAVESLFLQAEAIQRGWIGGNTEQAYKDAVRESFRWLNVGQNSAIPSLSDAVFNTWYDNEVLVNNPQVSWASAPDKYKLLMFQKYLALHTISPLETWTDYRRNGRYPDLPASLDPARVGSTIPIRLPYDLKEYALNAENVNTQGQINIFTSKIWWMP